VSCRTGLLRGGRSLRDFFTGLGWLGAWGLALLGFEFFSSRRGSCG